MLKQIAPLWMAVMIAVWTTICGSAAAYDLGSPSGNYRFSIKLEAGRLAYGIQYEGKTLVTPSRLGFRMHDGALLGTKISAIAPSLVSRNDSTWKPVYGERSTIRDNYNSQTFSIDDGNELAVAVEVRCYNEGVAFCYHIKPKDKRKEYVIAKELTEFAFTDDHATWVTESAQGVYSKTTIRRMKAVYERPQILFDGLNQIYLAIGEARLVDFARMKLAAATDREHSVVAALSGEVVAQGDLTTPWRFVMAAESPGALLENNDLIRNLNDPCAIADTSWIQPGKVLREVTLSTEGAIACIDYASRSGIRYVLFDAGWYGHEYDASADATTVTVDRKRSNGDLEMHKIIQYGKERGIGILLYVNRRALEKQIDEILPLYREWGVAGVKYGFVNVGSQEWTAWLHEAVRKAADHQLMVDIHDEYRPTGYSRTYPNLMTQEGIGGDETSPTPKTSLGIFFPRFLAGAADNTLCYYDRRVTATMNHAFQLGKIVCFYSPWQFIHWYDRPAASPHSVGGAGRNHSMIGDEPELEFFTHLPTVWDDTKVLEGSIEEYAVVARKSGDAWYVGAMNADEARRFEVKLDFLAAGNEYTIRCYTHDDSVPTRTKVKIEEQTVDANTILQIDLQSNDGAAYRITPRGRASTTMVSPDGKLSLQVEEAAAYLSYDAVFDGEVLLNDSRLGFDSNLFGEAAVRIERTESTTFDATWRPVVGKNREVRNHYNAYTLYCIAGDKEPISFEIQFRCYDDGFAYRYNIPEQESVEEITIHADRTKLHLPKDFTFWSYNGERHNLGPIKRSDENVPAVILPPMVIRTQGNHYMAILESGLLRQAPLNIEAPDDDQSLRIALKESSIRLPFQSSWRTFILGRRPGDLVESNLAANLNEPCKIGDFSWVRPGKSLWDWRVWGYEAADGFRYDLDTRSHLRMIDFAAGNNIQYLLIDADWYGDEFNKDSDPTTTSDKIDIETCMRHAKQRGVGVFLYLNDLGAKRFGLERILKQFSDWGAVGVKYGFMKGSWQEKAVYTRKVVELCAQYKLMVIFHDNPVPPSGDERTWPNLVAREFCHSQADAKRSYYPETAVTSPYVNMLGGPLDYCDGWFALHRAKESRIRVFQEIPGTVAAETAKLIVAYSGLRVLPDAPEEYLKKADLFECIRQMPPRFDCYKVLSGEIGEYISVARQAGDDWFIGTLTNRDSREVEIRFDFLPQAATYEATCYEDAADSHFQHSREDYSIREKTIQTGDTLTVRLAPGGGNAVHLKKLPN